MARSKTRRKTTPLRRNVRKGSDLQRLHIKVTSPRILMHQLIRVSTRGFKYLIFFGLLGSLVYGGYLGIERLFLTNDKYRLSEIDVETNGFLDAYRVIDIAKDEEGKDLIPLHETIFAIDAKKVEDKLSLLPEVEQCTVEKRLPGTLKIITQERNPVAWIRSDSEYYPGRSKAGILIDQKGFTFPCGEARWDEDEVKHLPVIAMNGDTSDQFKDGAKTSHTDTMLALRLMSAIREAGTRAEWWPVQINLVNKYSMEVRCHDDVIAVFGMDDHQRQIENYISIREYCLEENLKRGAGEKLRIKHMNLIPEINIPVQFENGPKHQADKTVLIKHSH